MITIVASATVATSSVLDERIAAATGQDNAGDTLDRLEGYPSGGGYDWLPLVASANDYDRPTTADGGSSHSVTAEDNASGDESPDSAEDPAAGEVGDPGGGSDRATAESGHRVGIERSGDGSFRYLVNGLPQLFVGIGYNPIYRYLPDEQRAANYERDFGIMCRAGVNHITGWDADKGFEQDKFDELTLDYAAKHGIGVVVPIYLPANGDYTDQAFRQALTDEAIAKVQRLKSHPAVRMWGVGNEVLHDMDPEWDPTAFADFYVQLVDLLHSLDPNHPIIYREAEDTYLWAIAQFWGEDGLDRRWLLYGLNSYTPRLAEIVDDWPYNGLNLPLFVSEFGADASWLGSRGEGYAEMWRMIRARPQYVLGGAPYAWSTAGPEPTDILWGLMNEASTPVDDAFDLLAAEWRAEPLANRCE